VVPRSPLQAQSGEWPTFSEGHMAPWAFCVTWGGNHRPWEADSHTVMANSEEQNEIIDSY
jgi:hypothetical protein